MQIDWIVGLIGGLMIGGAAAFYLLVNGQIMGASGILGGVIDRSARDTTGESIAFMAGLILVPGIVALVIGGFETHITGNIAVIVAAGLLVGIGTRLANGCTSGYGVCGISRLSLRGIVATAFYLIGGGLTMVAFRHVLGVI